MDAAMDPSVLRTGIERSARNIKHLVEAEGEDR